MHLLDHSVKSCDGGSFAQLIGKNYFSFAYFSVYYKDIESTYMQCEVHSAQVREGLIRSVMFSRYDSVSIQVLNVIN